MIRVRRPKSAPTVLLTEGNAARKADCREFEKNRGQYVSGKLEFKFKSTLYGHQSVKVALAKAQHGKCCYCEARFEHVDFGDIEHFRPKGAIQLRRGGKIVRPGYYWLAYDWENLFYSCAVCNEAHKKNLFPQRRGHKAVRNHKAKLTAEHPLLIDPAKDVPEALIGFREEIAYPIKNNAYAKTTIDVLDLNGKRSRSALVEARKERLKVIQVLKAIVERVPRLPEADQAAHLLQKAVEDSGEYANMARCALR